MVNIITPNSPATFNQRIAMSAAHPVGPLVTPAKLVPIQPPVNSKKPKNGSSKTILAIVGLFAFIGLASLAVLISFKQSTTKGPVAPNAPESKPKAYIEKLQTCTLSFEIPVACNSLCLQTSDCSTVNSNWDCLAPTMPVITPNPTTVAMMCGGIAGIVCPDGYKCNASSTIPDASGHCVIDTNPKISAKRCRLVTNPTSQTCTPSETITPSVTPIISLTPSATPPISLTPSVTPPISLTPSVTPTDIIATPTASPIPTIPPGITVNPTTPGLPPTYTVVTTVNCNDVCARNSDCSNISHICYNGKCRLDVNPESARCVMPAGENTIIVNVIPTRAPVPTELTKTGPADWANYLKVGFGALGIGALLLLFL